MRNPKHRGSVVQSLGVEGVGVEVVQDVADAVRLAKGISAIAVTSMHRAEHNTI